MDGLEVTKNRQGEETIKKMAEKYFPDDPVKEYRELKGGTFNVAYELQLCSGKTVILKVAPEKSVRVMASEKNIMATEVWAMELAGTNPLIPVAKVLGYDKSCTLCPSEYFFMEKLKGERLDVIKEQLSQEQQDDIYMQMGMLNKQINAFTGPAFGYPGQPDFMGDSWPKVFSWMIHGCLKDAEDAGVDLKISPEKLADCLEADRGIFEEVTVPRLVHWDGWDGNIFVENGRISGLIDWERALYGDPLMEHGFHSFSSNPAFLKGYGIERLTPAQHRRALWYDIYVLLVGTLECTYRKYKTMDMYQWASTLLKEQYDKLFL